MTENTNSIIPPNITKSSIYSITESVSKRFNTDSRNLDYSFEATVKKAEIAGSSRNNSSKYSLVTEILNFDQILTNKVECVLRMVIWSEFRMGRY